MGTPRAEKRRVADERRVVVTGLGAVCPVGRNVVETMAALRAGASGVRFMPEWSSVPDLKGRLGGVVPELDLELDIPAPRLATSGRVALLAAHATREALAQARLGDWALAQARPKTGGCASAEREPGGGARRENVLTSGRTGVAYGTTSSSGRALAEFASVLFVEHTTRGIDPSAWLRFMSHSVAANLAALFGVRGRVMPVCSACASGAQAIGYAAEAIRYGVQDVMICGGADEMHHATAAIFDVLMATSASYNERPDASPRPFDVRRDGLAVAEGAGTLILESEAHARARGATILAELTGFGTNCDGVHLTAPSREGMKGAMALSLADAGVDPDSVDYVNAHATGTELGDVEESHATRETFDREVPISSIKGALGHTLAACGAIEAVACVEMLRNGFVLGSRNLEDVDPRCGRLGYVHESEPRGLALVMSNNFAFGGVNSSLLFARASEERAR